MIDFDKVKVGDMFIAKNMQFINIVNNIYVDSEGFRCYRVILFNKYHRTVSLVEYEEDCFKDWMDQPSSESAMYPYQYIKVKNNSRSFRKREKK